MPSDVTSPQKSEPSIFVRLGKGAGLSVFVILMAELFLRVYAPVPMLPRYVTESELGIRVNMGDQVYTHTTPDYRVVIRTNSRGIRADEEIPYEKPAGIERIVVLGDSFMMGYGATLEEMALSVMVQRLESAGHRVQLINLAVSGFGNAEELLYLRAEGMKYDPDLIVLGWHDTDILDNMRSGLFALEDGRLVRRAESYLPGVRTRELLFKIPFYRFLAGNSHLYNRLRDDMGKFVKQLLADFRSSRQAATTAEPIPSVGEPAEPPDGLGYPEQLTIAILDEIDRVARAGGARFAILEIPVRRGRANFTSAFPVTARSERFPRFDPIPSFETRAGELLYWERSHYHFTPLGNRLVGEGMAELVLGLGLLDPTE